MSESKSMSWWKLDRNRSLGDYYLRFVITWPAALILIFAVLRRLFHVPTLDLVLPWAVVSAAMVLGGTPLLYWAHKSSLRTGSVRPVILATELMFLGCLVPFGYFLVKQEGFDLGAAIETALIVLIPFAWLFFFPPKLVRNRLDAARRKNDS